MWTRDFTKVYRVEFYCNNGFEAVLTTLPTGRVSFVVNMEIRRRDMNFLFYGDGWGWDLAAVETNWGFRPIHMTFLTFHSNGFSTQRFFWLIIQRSRSPLPHRLSWIVGVARSMRVLFSHSPPDSAMGFSSSSGFLHHKK